MSEDTISRQAAIDVLAEMQGRCTTKAALIQNSKIWQQIKDLPSAEPRWIPVTERLPENEQDVLVTVNDGCTHVEIDYFTGAHFLNYWDEVLAWMPLPEPWKGEDDG